MPYRTPAPHRWQPAAVRRPNPSELYTLMDISSRTGLPETLRWKRRSYRSKASAVPRARGLPGGSTGARGSRPTAFGRAAAARPSVGCGNVDYRENRAASGRITHSKFDRAGLFMPEDFASSVFRPAIARASDNLSYRYPGVEFAQFPERCGYCATRTARLVG